ncbi:MAG TPA: SDR family oxidoreductase [Methylovirgula sp.]|nr:SDR family oxidoreductase [Methylovirgula sp.]
MNEFADKVAIVTGGGMGLGRALCVELSKRGAAVVVADIDGEAARNAVDEIVGEGGRARAFQVDVSRRDDVVRLIDTVVSEFGGLDYIFNNAAIVIGGDTRDLSIEQYDRVLGVNLHGVVYGALAAYRVMVGQGHGHIVNVSSLSGLIPQPGNTPYSTAKWGLVGFSLALRYEGADLGVKVSCVCPGDMKTDIYKNMTVMNMDLATIERDSRRTHFLLPQWSAARAAQEILAGVAHNRAMIVFPWIGRVYWRLHRFVPSLVYSVTLRRMRSFRKMREKYLARHPDAIVGH